MPNADMQHSVELVAATKCASQDFAKGDFDQTRHAL